MRQYLPNVIINATCLVTDQNQFQGNTPSYYLEASLYLVYKGELSVETSFLTQMARTGINM